MTTDVDDPTPITVTVQDAPDGVVVVCAGGEIDQLTAPQLGGAIDTALDSASAVIVDLSDVRFFGSAGLAVLVEAETRAQKGTQPLRLVAEDDAVLRPLAMTGLDKVLSIYPTRDEALSNLTGGTVDL